MALAYKSPGVYVEEIDRGTKPIEAVGTSTAAFIVITAEAKICRGRWCRPSSR